MNSDELLKAMRDEDAIVRVRYKPYPAKAKLLYAVIWPDTRLQRIQFSTILPLLRRQVVNWLPGRYEGEGDYVYRVPIETVG